MSTRLHLLIPGLLGPFQSFGSAGITLSVPVLEKLLSRGVKQACSGKDYPTTLFSLFGYPLSEAKDLPEGAVNFFAGGEDTADACWMRADPVHLRPDRDRLLLFDSEQLDITELEAEEIARLFNDHFAEEPFQLVTPGPESWYLKLQRCPDLKTHDLSRVVGHHIEPFMPEGNDARRWRQLLNEMQMLLFQSAVNQQREAEGRVIINGLWLSGVGRLPEIQPARFGKVTSDDPTAVGLARLAKIQVEPVSDDNGMPWSEGEENLMMLTDLVSPVLNADPYGWSEMLNGLERRIGYLVDKLQRKHAQLVLYPCNGESYLVTASSLRRFWRRTEKLPALIHGIQ